MCDHRKIKTVKGLDLVRYSGLWYELARTPFEYETFQAGGAKFNCVSATAHYSLVALSENFDLESGRVGVKIVNRCISEAGIEIAVSTGLAAPLPASNPATSAAIFEVAFDSFEVAGPNGAKISLPTDSDMGKMSSGYWVHWVAPDYSLAVVGSPEPSGNGAVLKGKVWVLSRTHSISVKDMRAIRDKIADIGYDPSTVIQNEGTLRFGH